LKYTVSALKSLVTGKRCITGGQTFLVKEGGGGGLGVTTFICLGRLTGRSFCIVEGGCTLL